ncbi:MAG: metallophosphoesterase family protein [Alphaproteobacteria bacterium]
MFKKLFGRKDRAPIPDYSVPDGTVVYAIGDVHGRIDLLETLEQRIVADARARDVTRRVIVYLGDYVDRGYESRAVIEHLMGSEFEGFERVFLMGNHEEYMIRFLDDSSKARGWFANGGIETLMSYGVIAGGSGATDSDLARVQSEFRAALPDDHKAFLAGLPSMHREGDYVFVHAGIRPGVAIEEQSVEDMHWIRSDFLEDKRDFGVVVVHGHTITEHPVDRPNRIGVDTGAYASSRLTCAVLMGDRRTFMST